MRPVNLLPPRFQRARPSGGRAGVGYIAIGALAVLLLMVLLYVTTNNGITDAKNKTAEAQAEQAAAVAKAGQLQGFGDFAALKASREQAVKGVAQARFDYERLMRRPVGDRLRETLLEVFQEIQFLWRYLYLLLFGRLHYGFGNRSV